MTFDRVDVVVLSPSFSVHPQLRNELIQHFPTTRFNEVRRNRSSDEILELIGNADAVIPGTEKITRDMIMKFRNVKFMSKYGVGTDNIDLEALKERGIPFGWSGGVNKRSVSELALCFMLGLSRNILFSGVEIKQGKWNKFGGRQLSEKTVGIIGCGHIGSDLLQFLRPFNCRILVNDIADKSATCKQWGAQQIGLDQLLAESDIVSLHTPLDATTKLMVNESFLRKMKKNAFLINTARGGLVNEQDLLNAVENGTISGAAIDVLHEEPPTDRSLVDHPRIFTTPHIGGNADEAVLAMGRSAIEHLVSFYSR
jgi:phosphoglycerate dehydrogenase-like enzyme